MFFDEDDMEILLRFIPSLHELDLRSCTCSPRFLRALAQSHDTVGPFVPELQQLTLESCKAKDEDLVDMYKSRSQLTIIQTGTSALRDLLRATIDDIGRRSEYRWTFNYYVFGVKFLGEGDWRIKYVFRPTRKD